jgi:hypothetical protein
MESSGFNGPTSNVVVSDGTLTNATDGTIQVNAGNAGGRTITGNLTNRGTINVASGITLVSELQGFKTDCWILLAERQLALSYCPTAHCTLPRAYPAH